MTVKVKLRLRRKNVEVVKRELESSGIEISEDADLILTEEDYFDQTFSGHIFSYADFSENEYSSENVLEPIENLRCKDGGDTVILPVDDICYIESLGHDVFVNTFDNIYAPTETII